MTELSRVPLAEIRRRLAAARTPRARRRLVAELDGDPRRGARALGRRALADETRHADERKRLTKLFARRDRLLRAGVRFVAGVDEVGVGPLAGPVVAAAVVLPRRLDLGALDGLDDSKKLTSAAREVLAKAIRAQAVAVSVAEVSVDDIDRLNIYHASHEAMRRAVRALDVRPEQVFVDARTIPDIPMRQAPIVHGDAFDGSIAAASIVAKVWRDARMRELAERYAGYGFEKHMGYATRQHLDALRELGATPMHRRSFAPVARALEAAEPTDH